MTATQPRRRVLLGLSLAGLVFCSFPTGAGAQIFRDGQTAPLTVQIEGGLPGFRAGDDEQYLAGQMAKAGLTAWSFQPAIAADSTMPADRVVWIVQPQPYASGGVRQFFPIPGVLKQFGPHKMISVEVRLYLDGQYQTAVSDQAVVQGGAQDKVLADFVARLSQDLLGMRGAYRASDTVPDETLSKKPAQ